MTAALSRGERRTLALLGLPALALALAVTTVSTYLPPVAREYLPSTTLVGLLIGVEGLMALWVPLVVGRGSDRLGRRLPFVLLAAPVLAVSLVAVGLARSVVVALPVLVVFYAAYFVAYEPYRALYPDLVRDDAAGRAQSSQAVFRGVGTFIALAAGGALLELETWLPFLVFAVLTALALAGFALTVRRLPTEAAAGAGGEHAPLRDVWRREPRLRAFLAANGCWELSLAALKTFVFVYVIEQLDLSPSMASVAIGTGAVFVLAGSAGAGALADRLGAARVMAVATTAFGTGMAVPLLTTTPWAVMAATPVITIAGGVLLSLPYALLQPLMPAGERGAITGLYSASRGVGIALGPVLAGAAIDLGGEPRWMWLVAGLAALASLPFLRRVGR